MSRRLHSRSIKCMEPMRYSSPLNRTNVSFRNGERFVTIRWNGELARCQWSRLGNEGGRYAVEEDFFSSRVVLSAGLSQSGGSVDGVLSE